jgi:hypothetical protein
VDPEAMEERIAAHELGEPGLVEAWERLSSKVLANGGEGLVCLPRGELASFSRQGIEAIAELGKFVTGDNAEFVEGGDDAQDSADYGGTSLGFALSHDGLWRWHLWDTKRDGAIIEATTPRRGYFGTDLAEFLLVAEGR